MNILNPNLWIFFFALLPQFVTADEPHPVAPMLVLSVLFMLQTFAVFVDCGLFYATTSSPVRAG
jgi:threonine/homoserine/homoserine lactone efflux protein